MTDTPVLKAPFPWMGGKARVADLVWSRLGNVDNFVEPFAGSLAVLLRRPAEHFAGGYRVETANDANHHLVNLWRSIAHAPEKVAEYADWPVFEADLHARHKWLVRSDAAKEFRKRVGEDPDYFDPKFAGWWCWGQCCWIGSGWCVDNWTADGRDSSHKEKMPELVVGRSVTAAHPEPATQVRDLSGGFGQGTGVVRRSGPAPSRQVPDLTSGGCGVAAPAKLPELASGVGRGDASAHQSQQVPHMDAGGRGVHGRPQLADAFDIGRGVNGNGGLAAWRPDLAGSGGGHQGVLAQGGPAALAEKVPLLSHTPGKGVCSFPGAGTCEARRAWLVDWMRRLADRLRLVRTCYGHWSRVCDSDSTLTRLGTTGVFLDPPYPTHRADTGKQSRAGGLYATDKGSDLNALRDDVLAWCRRWGQCPQIRVALCCYEGDGYEPLAAEGWAVESWEASGGYGNQRKGKKGKAENAKRERIFFSPHCVKPAAEPTLFDFFPG